MTELEKRLLQAMHDTRIILGFDVDGDTTPWAEVFGTGVDGYIENFLRDMRRARKGHDEAVDEVCMDPRSHAARKGAW